MKKFVYVFIYLFVFSFFDIESINHVIISLISTPLFILSIDKILKMKTNNSFTISIFLFFLCFFRLLLMSVFILFFNDVVIILELILLLFLSVIVNAKYKKFEKSETTNNVELGFNTPISNENKLCEGCGAPISNENKLCEYCGTPVNKSGVVINSNSPSNNNDDNWLYNPNLLNNHKQVKILTITDFDSMYSLNEKELIKEFINRELTKAGFDRNSKLIPQAILNRKKKLSLIFSILLSVYLSMIFFHFPYITYIIGLIILIIFIVYTLKFNLTNYLAKEMKARPNEKVSNIIMLTKSTLVVNNYKKNFVIGCIIAILLPIIIFWNPRVFYEEVYEGVAVRYYTFGITNFTTAEIPERYNDKNVVMLRGNSFSNMPFLKEVILPDTIEEIRGQAFLNDFSLVKVKLPKNLKFLGGGAFYNCKSLTEINLPDTLIELGGESFYGCSSLKNVELSSNLSEIRGDTFSGCTSLEKIKIPDNITRIGGYAFYDNHKLYEVALTENSKLNEIGSSAFRNCNSLYEITIPKGTYVNQRAFKNSPTNVEYFDK